MRIPRTWSLMGPDPVVKRVAVSWTCLTGTLETAP